MVSEKINAYLDFELTKKLESFVINALPEQTYRSDFNMMYIANIDITEEDNIRYQASVTSEDTFFISINNDLGHIDFDIIKTIHIAGVLESDFEVMDYYPAAGEISKFANFYEGNEVPPGGGYLHIAICPFGVNKVELLNGDIIHIYGTGKYRITTLQRGFKGYSQIPKVPEILSNDFFKILKLAIYTRYIEYSHRKYTLNLFSPTMTVVQKEIEGQIPIDDPRLIFYNKASVTVDAATDSTYIVDDKSGAETLSSFTTGEESILHGIGNMIRVQKHGFIDLSEYADSIGDEFSIHMNVVVNNYANRGSVLFELGYGVTNVGFQTHHITLWLNKDGYVMYNTQYSDEWVNTGFQLKTDFEHTITFTVENQKYDADDDNEYMSFIHINGKQIWPEKNMLSPTEKIYLWRSMEAFRTYTDVCMKLPAPDPINGGLDAKMVCAKKLLHESGFITLDNMLGVYELYLRRPKANDADLNEIIIGSEENTMVKKMFFGQDSEKDIFDDQYYFDGQFAEIAIFSPALKRDEIEMAHLLNIIRSETVKV